MLTQGAVDIDRPEPWLELAPEELADGGVRGQAVEFRLVPAHQTKYFKSMGDEDQYCDPDITSAWTPAKEMTPEEALRCADNGRSNKCNRLDIGKGRDVR